MKNLKLILLVITTTSLIGCNSEYDYSVAYNIDLNAEYQYTSANLELKDDKCFEVTTQKNFGKFDSKISQKEIELRHCAPIKLGQQLKAKYGTCEQKRTLLAEGNAKGEVTHLVLDQDCICYEEYIAGSDNLQSDVITKKSFATWQQCKEFIPADKHQEILQEYIKYKLNAR